MNRKMVFALAAVAIFSLSASMVAIAPVVPRNDPLPSANFRVEIDGLVASSFASVEGLGSEMEVVEYRPGTQGNEITFLPGLSRVRPMALARGITDDTELWDWYETNRDSPVDIRNIAIIIQDRGRNDKVRYTFRNCWPSAYYVEPLESIPGNVAYEILVVQCDSMEME